MPELPEIEVVVAHLRARLHGARIQSLWIGRQDIVRHGLSTSHWYCGARIDHVFRWGKSLVIQCQRQANLRYLVVELGMTGLLLCDRSLLPDEKHLHMAVGMRDAWISELLYWNARRFGRIWLLDHEELQNYGQRRFGADPREIQESEFVRLVKTYRGRVKSLLLRQQRLAGIGNIYANEILYRAGIHPHTCARRLSNPAIQRLYLAMHHVLEEAIRAGGSSIRDFRAPDGMPGRYQHYHQVYQKSGHPCPRGCPTPIRSLMAERRSFYCPTCQRRW
ncbi:MAG: bifunctional DNA-formamidopyrimidine glycosylase/DNA-(apurinic or apyrimidinic site) lyase [Nitrospirae bacterium]|nr:MAG: bifunctional DNA-formamidopyrimidine glycosylase/DNA-(apurinic or apyrimidinic site) lyase [Nitrospirota bacterium]